MKEFTYQFNISASQEEVYTALTNSFQIELWTGYPATMDDKVGTVFSLWEGDISGCNLEMVKDYKIVQEWFFGETENPSIVSMILKKAGKDTRIELTHTNIPDDAYEEIVEGWKEYYLDSVKNFLEFY
ncbi:MULTISPECIES: SRPBCC domain-containing protein [Marinifilum]|uniref:Activator of Hsp90 ATPase-like protein n=1 Tax=Marinifilum flexuosum TaxID=1117708 RepID=A0A419X8H8_9BACT|nr:MULTISPECIES: SRPBCC domain-containing protein [Marinifilum]MCY1635144.1 SRPBCC domain-containing protein [Marinifilum sp. D737]RKE04054.1 activator of Hsp90 ATPase-like protein [Marinifilum flexuosum]